MKTGCLKEEKQYLYCDIATNPPYQMFYVEDSYKNTVTMLSITKRNSNTPKTKCNEKSSSYAFFYQLPVFASGKHKYS